MPPRSAKRPFPPHRPEVKIVSENDLLTLDETPSLHDATLVLAFTGWMDGGDVSTGTVQHLVALLGARPMAEIDPEPFYIYNVPGPMEVAAMFRPHVEIEEGLIKKFDWPSNTFYGNPATQHRAVHRPRAALAMADLRPLHVPIGPAGGREPHRVRRLVRRAGAAHAAAAAVRDLFRGATAAGNGAVCRAPQRLRRARFLHHLFDDAGQERGAWRWCRSWPRCPATCKA